MTDTVTVLPAPKQAEDEVRTVAGTVIDPADVLKQNESNIRKNFKKFEAVQASVARSLNIIYHNDLWKLHTTTEGKRRYTNFNDYLETEFGWDKSGARARQIMKADQEAAIIAKAIPAEVGDKRRNRAAPEVTADRAATVTIKQLTTVLEAFATRLDTVEQGEGFTALEAIFAQADEAISGIIASLSELVDTITAEADAGHADADEADAADEDEDEDDDSAEDDDDSEE